MVRLDERWYMDLNRLARRTPWLHSAMAWYYERRPSPVGLGLVLVALLVTMGWWRARGRRRYMPAVLWAGLGALVVLGLDELLVRAIAQPAPYQVLKGVEVLVPRGSRAEALPDIRVAVAFAAACGLALAHRWWLAGTGMAAAVVLAFAGMYVGVAYPSDMAAGAGFGLLASIVLWPLGSWLLSPLAGSSPGSRRPGPRGGGLGLPDAKALRAIRAATEASHRRHGSSDASALRGREDPVAGGQLPGRGRLSR